MASSSCLKGSGVINQCAVIKKRPAYSSSKDRCKTQKDAAKPNGCSLDTFGQGQSSRKFIIQVFWDLKLCRWVFAGVSKYRSVSVFKIQGFQALRYSDIQFFSYCIGLKLKALRPFEMPGNTHQTTQPESSATPLTEPQTSHSKDDKSFFFYKKRYWMK